MKRNKLQAKKQECEEKQKTAQDVISKLCTEKSALYNELDQLKLENTKYKQALDEIEQVIYNFPSREIQKILQTQVEFTQYILHVGEAKLRKISGIIYELRRDDNG